jgi:hypothetical protein
MLFVGLGILLFGSMSYQIYTRSESMDIITLVSMILFTFFYFIGGIYLFFYDKINAFLKTLRSDKEPIQSAGGAITKYQNDNTEEKNFLTIFLGSVFSIIGSFLGSITNILKTFIIPIGIITCLLFFISCCLILFGDDKAKKAGIIILEILYGLYLVVTTLIAFKDKTINIISLFIVPILIACFLFSNIYYYISEIHSSFILNTILIFLSGIIILWMMISEKIAIEPIHFLGKEFSFGFNGSGGGNSGGVLDPSSGNFGNISGSITSSLFAILFPLFIFILSITINSVIAFSKNTPLSYKITGGLVIAWWSIILVILILVIILRR